MNRAVRIPFGPDFKDPTWRWASFLMGIATFVALIAIATLGGIMLIGFWWFFAVFIAILLSLRSGRAWARGIPPHTNFALTVSERAVEAPRRAQVRPREFGPFWWAVYSVFVRAPVGLGDLVLTVGWRLADGLWSNSTGVGTGQDLQVDDLDYTSDLPQPDKDTF